MAGEAEVAKTLTVAAVTGAGPILPALLAASLHVAAINAFYSVTLPNPVTLRVSAFDDGLPKPVRRSPTAATAAPAPGPATLDPNARRRRAEGLRIRWIQYRGPGKVTFDPANVPAVYGKPVDLTTKVSFSAPGTYLLRAIASDGQLESMYEVTVTVNPAGSAQNR